MIIVSAADDRYAPHLAVMLTSLLHHNRKHADLRLYVVDGDVSEENKHRLQRTAESFRRTIRFVTIRDSRYSTLKVHPKKDYISKTTFARIFIPELLGDDIRKALYLDCDLIVLSDLSPLWNITLNGRHFAAAVDISPVQSKAKRKKMAERLSLPADAPYFNAGVLLMNLPQWRKHRIVDRTLAYLAVHGENTKYNDQDALNVVLRDRWRKLSPKWNYTSKHQTKMPLAHPAIVHFTGKRKPWNSDGPYGTLYAEYFRRSLWENELETR
mgnify:CR=1 FL=1